MKFQKSDVVQAHFSEMGMAAPITEALARIGIEQPTPIQTQALPVALAGSDMVGVAQTGSGKTLVFGLAILSRLLNEPASRALILTPSRETADQIFKVIEGLFGELPISKCLVVAGQPDKKQVSQLNKLPRLIVATPGRMLDHLSHNKLLLQKLSIMVVDEADRMLDVGFGPQLKRIRATLRGDFQTMMYGASFDQKVEKFAEGFFRPQCYLVRTEGAEKPVATLRQVIMFTESGLKMERLLDVLKKAKAQSIVFVNDQPTAEDVHDHLLANSFSSDMIHGGLEHGHRQRVVRDFREEKFRTLVTTDLLARGLDVPNIELVVNFDLPNETEDFLHRIGRTARAGNRGTAVTFVTSVEEAGFKRFKAYTEGAEEVSGR